VGMNIKAGTFANLEVGDKAARLIIAADRIAEQTHDFFEAKGPGPGDHAANAFMQQLRDVAKGLFGQDFSEARISGNCGFKVDFYFPDEQTVVEFAFSLDKPMNEFERDIFKCLLAQENGHTVKKLILVSKPGGRTRIAYPGPSAIRQWVGSKFGLGIEVLELRRPA
jgi:hypothetical protein